MDTIKNTYQKQLAWARSLPLNKKVLLVVAIVLFAGIIGYPMFKKDTAANIEEVSGTRTVHILSVQALNDSGTPLSLSGEVKSRSEANIRTEASGRVTHVYKKLGDSVGAGEVIAEIENAREMAALAQAKAFLAQAQASQNISEISQGSAETLLKEARTSVVNTLRSTYDGVEDAIRNKIDPMFSNPETANPRFNVQSTNSQLMIDANSERVKIQAVISAERERRNNLSIDNDLLAEISLTEKELMEVKKLVDTINATLNLAIATLNTPQSTIDAYKAVASSVRTSWTGMVAGISTSKDNFTAKTTQYQIAQKQGNDIVGVPTVSQATIAQAETGVALARIALEKTIIRSPIFGTLNSLPLTQGDFVSPFQPAATISNNNALEIIAYISALESKEISVGSKVIIEDTAEGIVTRVAPALDPLTKKIEVRIGVSKGLGTLLNGQSVNLSITRSKELGETTSRGNSKASISIPIVALKITPDGPVVFTVEEGALKSHPVTIGSLLGDRITVIDGLISSMEIVTDARGLKDGQKVKIK